MQARAEANLVKMYKLTMYNVPFRVQCTIYVQFSYYRKNDNDNGKP